MNKLLLQVIHYVKGVIYNKKKILISIKSLTAIYNRE